jgi:hypothetical protein
MCGSRDLLYGVVECQFVRFGGPIETAQLSDELEGGCTDLLVRGRGLEVMQRLDVSAHEKSSSDPTTVRRTTDGLMIQ